MCGEQQRISGIEHAQEHPEGEGENLEKIDSIEKQREKKYESTKE